MYRILLLLLAHSALHKAQDSNITGTVHGQRSLCVLPPYPVNGTYTVVNKPDARPGEGLQALHLTYECHHDNKLVGDKEVHCINNIWSSEAPKCENEIFMTSVDGKIARRSVIANASSGWTFSDKSGATQENNMCVKNGQQGVCRIITDCESAKRELEGKKQPQICAFKDLVPVVCCFDDVPNVATPTPLQLTTSAAEDTPPLYEYEDIITTDNAPDECDPLPSGFTSQKTGQKAWDKCIENQVQYVYPCMKRVALTGGGKIRANHCRHELKDLDPGRGRIVAGQFPHMVLLGFGDDTETAEWWCGGTIISEKFVMTAAHCVRDRTQGDVKYIRTGLVKRSEPLDPKRLYGISRIILHPEFRAGKKYNDIAVLEADRIMFLDQFAMPACLPVGNSYNDSRAVAIGFGRKGFQGEISDSLQEVVLTKFSTEACSKTYPPNRRMSEGLQESIQLCYGDNTTARDTCQGDSGGPLHILNKDIRCMYTVIGIIAFGRGCGIVGIPGIYTRVAAYVPWIESVVWPN